MAENRFAKIGKRFAYRSSQNEAADQLFGAFKMAAGSPKMAARSVFAPCPRLPRARKWLPDRDASLNGEFLPIWNALNDV